MKHAEKVQFDIANSDGNAFALIGGWKRAARREGWSEDDIEAVLVEAMSGDYDHLVQTIMGYSECVSLTIGTASSRTSVSMTVTTRATSTGTYPANAALAQHSHAIATFATALIDVRAHLAITIPNKH